ncbi:MAG: hypothetical protein LBR27_03405 [Bifidobacteriaceae bacterium]|jgi:hypothetical protein|nr:hypothetical protein [Bifidobacteriaceae bacterium]
MTSISGRAVAGLATLALGLAALGGCSGDEPDVASLGDETASGSGATSTETATTEAEREATVNAMVDCLVEAGVPAKAQEVVVNGVSTLDLMFDGQLVSTRDPSTGADGFGGISTSMIQAGGGAPVDEEKHSQIFEAIEGDYALVIDAVDYTADYQRCYVETGYSPREIVMEDDPASELRAKQEVAEVSNEWAACARDQGYEDVTDAEPPTADGYETYPYVMVPGTITLVQFQELLEACPLLDVEAMAESLAEAQEQAEDEGPSFSDEGDGVAIQGGGGVSMSIGGQSVVLPSIAFDLPGFDQAGGFVEGEVTEEDQAHMTELTDALNASIQDLMEQAGMGSAVTIGGGGVEGSTEMELEVN